MLRRSQLLPRPRSRLHRRLSEQSASRALSIPPPPPSPLVPPPPALVPPTLGVRMCSMAGTRLQGPRRARPHAPACVCGATGGARGVGFAPGRGRNAGLAPPPGAPRAAPGLPRGPRERTSAPAPTCAAVAPHLYPSGRRRGLSLPLKRGSRRSTVRPLFPKTQRGPCVGCGLLEERWGSTRCSTPPLGFLPGRPKIGGISEWGGKEDCHRHSRTRTVSWARGFYSSTGELIKSLLGQNTRWGHPRRRSHALWSPPGFPASNLSPPSTQPITVCTAMKYFPHYPGGFASL
ncbi:uncharacterized protein LOC128929422 isoform X2 [Callithrix jacchus]|uniref:potassium/sodium hyperpolarization-activated cyclic nucleotide-gated channel 4-like isoform X2 n=1 Tax=Callithrix jacchus TaxID=9483 RepID=UPI0023DD39A1|nr:potassium/sodium hyperpolarization-activated cyclic nucleotide-gated channel 4-like isoform X2 [Callithrix jacchus]